MTNAKLDLRNPIFHDDNAAREHLEALLWPRPCLPPLRRNRRSHYEATGQEHRPGVYKCKDCRKPFTVTVGTVMERSHIPLSKWVLAAQLMASSKKSMSAHQLHRMLGTNYETAWFLFHRLREARMISATHQVPSAVKTRLWKPTKAYIGGKARNKAFGPPPKKYAVFTLVEREGKARSRHVADVTAKTLREAIVTQASRKSYLMTDEALVYAARPRVRRPRHRQPLGRRICSAPAASTTPTRSKASSPCSSEQSTVNSTTSARLTCIATLPKQTSSTITVQHSAMTTWSARLRCSVAEGQTASISTA